MFEITDFLKLKVKKYTIKENSEIIAIFACF